MSRRITSAALIVVVVVGCVVAVWYRFTSGDENRSSATPSESSPEAGFARDMAVHHTQAVEMADIIRTRTADDALVALATDIVLTQQNQVGRFYGWLDQWQLAPSSAAPMEWMSADHPNMPMVMPGMASRDEIRTLSDLSTDDAEVQFLRLMIRHHRGGLEMAERVVQLTDRTEVLAVAESVRQGQTVEIDAMNTMLAERGEVPE